MMKSDELIQLDMYEVQLGASVFVQFKLDSGKVVRILADAGTSHGKYPEEHIYHKVYAEFGQDINDRYIDLIVGTHYDMDHLNCLVPIINDTTITIKEAWLPPVENDTEVGSDESELHDGSMLAIQLLKDNGSNILGKYLDYKRRVCIALWRDKEKVEKHFGLFEQNEKRSEIRRKLMDHEIVFSSTNEDAGRNNLETAEGYFSAHILDAQYTLGKEEGYDHADVNISSLLSLDELLLHPNNPIISLFTKDLLDIWLYDTQLLSSRIIKHKLADEVLLSKYAPDPRSLALNLAFIQKSAAKDAITAIYLDNVVKALKKRNIPIKCQVIDNGTPRKFMFDETSGIFTESAIPNGGLELCLLGPSKGLVKKHRHRLPEGSYALLAAFTSIPIESITPSNELSYIFRFGYKGQGILISGDAGCVDFTKAGKTREYHQALLDALLPLQVIQVAHHGGRNAHFYRVLLAAGYGSQNESSLLLLSHETNSRPRPSKVFFGFVDFVHSQKPIMQNGMKLLFTSQPKPDKVEEYKTLVHKAIGTKNHQGDIQLKFKSKSWEVSKHSISV